MLPTSIHWRLPLSYAAIALLTTLALGAILLTILQRFYRQQELDYLTNNAQTISANLSPLIEAGLPSEAIESQLSSLAFLSQTQVRLLSPNGEVLASSGDPSAQQEVLALSLEVEVEADTSTQTLTQTIAVSGPTKSYAPLIAIKHISVEEDVLLLPDQEDNVVVKRVVALKAGDPTHLEALIQQELDQLEQFGLVSSFAAQGTPYGFGLGINQPVGGPRSQQMVKHPIRDNTGTLRGYVELSNGPAYGRQVLNSVAWGWGIAGSVGVLLAATVGWWMSRRMSEPLLALTQTTARMAQGDLSTRAEVARWDEFGMLADAFNHMAQRVEETVITLRRFAADAAHELYTPLTALRTQLELALDDDSDQRLHLEQAQLQLARLETLTNDLLDLSRLESGATQPNIQPVNLNQLLQTLGESYASRAEQAGVSFSLHLPQQQATTPGNEAQLHRAIGNLLDNALKFTPPGGSISMGLGIGPDETYHELWVEDSGIGIPDDELDQLFNRFHRGRNAAGYAGNGLGLAIVNVIVDKHKGRVIAANTQTGSRFTIRLTVV